MPHPEPVFVFLYTELAGYIRNCMEHLAASGAEVHVVSFPVNPEAPFDFDTRGAQCNYLRRNDFDEKSLLEYVRRLRPNAVVCSGWIDRTYVRTCAALRRSGVRTVLALDNPYPRTARGKAGLLRAKLLYKSSFDAAWVPGDPQVRYARALGFSAGAVYRGFYAADTERFARFAERRPADADAERFLYFGRYLDFKGIDDLWEAYGRLGKTDWELWCAGTGARFETRPEMPGLRHFGFVQPDDLDTFVADGGVFVMPGRREPWGVALQEFAAAGLPLIATTAVGAATAFLQEGINGITVPPGNPTALHSAMKAMTEKTPEERRAMGRISYREALKVNKETWVRTALEIAGPRAPQIEATKPTER